MFKILISEWIDPLEKVEVLTFHVFMYEVMFHLNGEDPITNV